MKLEIKSDINNRSHRITIFNHACDCYMEYKRFNINQNYAYLVIGILWITLSIEIQVTSRSVLKLYKKKSRIKHIRQRRLGDSGIACLAMVTNHSYNYVAAFYKSNKELTIEQLIKFLSCYGYWTKLQDAEIIYFSQCYIIYIQTDNNLLYYIVMDDDGNIYDPSGKDTSDYCILKTLSCHNKSYIGDYEVIK